MQNTGRVLSAELNKMQIEMSIKSKPQEDTQLPFIPNRLLLFQGAIGPDYRAISSLVLLGSAAQGEHCELTLDQI